MSRTGAKLGQHFLKHPWAAKALAYGVGVQDGDTILEIGPGKGILTRELLAFGSVVAIEKDESLIEILKDTFSNEIEAGTLTLVASDVRDITPEALGLVAGKYVLAANIPYYITGEIIRQFLSSDSQPHSMALLIQKEVAQRITSTKESILSLSVKAYGQPKIIEKVSRTQFSPPPSVDSAILSVKNISKIFFFDITEQQFFDVVHAGFSSKRKIILNNLSVTFGKEIAQAALLAAGVSEKARAETIGLLEWKKIVKTITENATDNFLAAAR